MPSLNQLWLVCCVKRWMRRVGRLPARLRMLLPSVPVVLGGRGLVVSATVTSIPSRVDPCDGDTSIMGGRTCCLQPRCVHQRSRGSVMLLPPMGACRGIV